LGKKESRQRRVGSFEKRKIRQKAARQREREGCHRDPIKILRGDPRQTVKEQVVKSELSLGKEVTLSGRTDQSIPRTFL